MNQGPAVGLLALCQISALCLPVINSDSTEFPSVWFQCPLYVVSDIEGPLSKHGEACQHVDSPDVMQPAWCCLSQVSSRAAYIPRHMHHTWATSMLCSALMVLHGAPVHEVPNDPASMAEEEI